MKKLYPLKFTPILKEKIWGGEKLEKILHKNIPGKDNWGESWDISTYPGNISVVCNGFLEGNSLEELIEVYMGDLVGEKIYTEFGLMFPLLIKYIDANDILSIQVHPDDETAKERHGSFGKTEMWYIMDAEPGSELIMGFNRDLNRETYQEAVKQGKIEEILNKEKVQKGDVYFIPAGRIHTAGAGLLLAEIQQTSDITYRIYDWNRTFADGNPRELHNDLALDVLDFKHYDEYKTVYKNHPNETSEIITCKYFKTNTLLFNEIIEKNYALLDSFVIYMCVEGNFTILTDTEKTPVQKGESVLIPADIKNVRLVPDQTCKLLEVYIP